MIAGVNLLGRVLWKHSDFDNLMLKLGVDVSGRSIAEKANSLIVYARDNPSRRTDGGQNLWDAIVEEAVRIGSSAESSTELQSALAHDGYEIEATENGYRIQRRAPAVAAIQRARDELENLLDDLALTTPKGHYEQALTAHAARNWAAANAQLRTFLEGVFDEIAAKLVPSGTSRNGSAARQMLATLPSPFLDPRLNEWTSDGKNFIEGVFKRLHPNGSHPGLSDEEDSTFRLQLVSLVAWHYLRRLKARLEPP